MIAFARELALHMFIGLFQRRIVRRSRVIRQLNSTALELIAYRLEDVPVALAVRENDEPFLLADIFLLLAPGKNEAGLDEGVSQRVDTGSHQADEDGEQHASRPGIDVAALVGEKSLRLGEDVELTYNGAAITLMVASLLAVGIGLLSYRTMDDHMQVPLVDDLVAAIAEKWPGCLLCVCSDLTKRYERIYRGEAGRVLEQLRANPGVEKGEYCLAADISMLPPAPAPAEKPPAEAWMLSRLLDGEELSEAAREAQDAGYARNEVYRAKLRIAEMFEDE